MQASKVTERGTGFCHNGETASAGYRDTLSQESMRMKFGAHNLYREALVQASHDSTTREVLGKFHIYVTESAPAAVEEAGPYLRNYWTVADAKRPGRAAARPIWAAEQSARGNVIAGEPQRCIDLIQRWRDALGLTVVSGTSYFGGMPQEMEPQFERRYRLWQDIHRLLWERVPFLLYGDVFNLTGMHKHVQGPFDMPSWYFWNV
jgi:alkanesulfonate monooxygenase SsuD/methylene tetrahydromethanopterin reductase-like flavin-dependent oxidoreductase (luciferase family)